MQKELTAPTADLSEDRLPQTRRTHALKAVPLPLDIIQACLAGHLAYMPSSQLVLPTGPAGKVMPGFPGIVIRQSHSDGAQHQILQRNRQKNVTDRPWLGTHPDRHTHVMEKHWDPAGILLPTAATC